MAPSATPEIDKTRTASAKGLVPDKSQEPDDLIPPEFLSSTLPHMLFRLQDFDFLFSTIVNIEKGTGERGCFNLGANDAALSRQRAGKQPYAGPGFPRDPWDLGPCWRQIGRREVQKGRRQGQFPWK